jgi:hypothetical protein
MRGGGGSSTFGQRGSRMLERRLQPKGWSLASSSAWGSDEEGGGCLHSGEVGS